MKTATFPSLRVDPELRQAAEASLQEGETISSFVEQSIRDKIERRQRQREFLARGLASREETARTGTYLSSGEVIGRLEQMLAKGRRNARPRGIEKAGMKAGTRCGVK